MVRNQSRICKNQSIYSKRLISLIDSLSYSVVVDVDVKDAYDDKMIANIELKSQDFDDENFSPVFNRKTQEYFLEPSEKFKSDHAKVLY